MQGEKRISPFDDKKDWIYETIIITVEECFAKSVSLHAKRTSTKDALITAVL